MNHNSMRNGIASVAVVVERCEAWRWNFDSDCGGIDCTADHSCENSVNDMSVCRVSIEYL